jgi:ornithine carbamoyltransferase
VKSKWLIENMAKNFLDRISSEVGMNLLGGQALFLSSDDIQLGVNESLKDTALVLSRFNTIILARVYGHKDVCELAELATVPVINALSDKYHPLQALADYMTVKVSNVFFKRLFV